VVAATGGGAVGPATPLTSSARNRAAKGIGDQIGSDHPLTPVVKLSAFEQLMILLRHPRDDDWRKLATAVALAPVPAAAVFDVADVDAAVVKAAKGEQPTPSRSPTDAKAATWETTGGLTTHAILDAAADRDHSCAAIVSLDTRGEVAQTEWADWLHLGNVLAGLAEHAVITTTRAYEPGAVSALPSEVGTAAPESLEALLEDCFDDPARVLASTVAREGHKDLVVGYETGWADGTVLEIAWPAQRVGILPAGADAPADSDGWSVRRSTEWTTDELSLALTAGAS
jgi:hypothetical protein